MSPNAHYRSGDNFEKRVKSDLEHNGYIVLQSRGSKTVVDLMAAKVGEVLFIQAKAGRAAISDREWNGLHERAVSVGAVPIVADAGPAPRYPIRYRRIVARHRLRERAWPAEPWTPDEVTA